MTDLTLPDFPVVVLQRDGVLWISPDGDIESADKKAAPRLLSHPVIVCNMPLLVRRLELEHWQALDVLELFAFVRPAQFCVPTPQGLATALNLPMPHTATEQALFLVDAIAFLLTELQKLTETQRDNAIKIAEAMAASAPIWNWSPYVLAAMGVPLRENVVPFVRESMDLWRQLPEWEDKPPRGPAGQQPVTEAESRAQLHRLVEAVIGSTHNRKAEPRPEQADYASALSAAFAAPKQNDKAEWVFAEAGTGVGKTLGYLAPALAWASKNDGQVWISTFTRTLQNQLQHDLDRVFPAEQNRVVVRKGRENYLCLLNLEESLNQMVTGDERTRTGLGLMLRWVMATREGDLTGGDLPGWLPVLVGVKATTQLSDRRGECIHQTCPHYQRCFIEHNVRASKDASIVVANHALTLVQPFEQGDEHEQRNLPQHVVWDEGHHVFDAADSAYAVEMTGNEMAEMKRWLIGDHPVKRFRRRGLLKRMQNTVDQNHPLWDHLNALREAAHFLPEPGWMERVHKMMPHDTSEEFLLAVMQQVRSRNDMPDSPYDLETDVQPLSDDLALRANTFALQLRGLLRQGEAFASALAAELEEAVPDKQYKRGLGALIRSVQNRCIEPLRAWLAVVMAMLEQTPENYVDWLGVRRIDGRDVDAGVYRHFLDPMQPLVSQLNAQMQGVVVTSATLKASQSDQMQAWAQAEQRLGGPFLQQSNVTPLRVSVPSPFDYAQQTRVFLINDVDGNDNRDVAQAFAALFSASNGGALGLFTAIRRLRATHKLLQKSLLQQDIPLYAQHVDGLNTTTLVDLFRAEEDACLLGTDALRDGVDVPGRALRLVVYDRIPWPRPGILHRARRDYFGKRDYDMLLTSMRLRQSFGRLIRAETDRGAFVLLESALPSTLYKAFPTGVTIEKLTLSDACDRIKEFLNAAESARVPALEA